MHPVSAVPSHSLCCVKKFSGGGGSRPTDWMKLTRRQFLAEATAQTRREEMMRKVKAWGLLGVSAMEWGGPGREAGECMRSCL